MKYSALMAGSVTVLQINSESGWRGGENQVYLLQKGLEEMHSGTVNSITVCKADEALHTRLLQDSLNHKAFPVKGSADLSFVRKLTRFIKDNKVDIIHAHASHAHTLGMYASLLSGKPLIVTRRVDFAVGKGLIGKIKYRKAAKRVIAISQAIKEVLLRGGVDADRISIINSGIDPQRFHVNKADLKEFSIPQGAPCVIAVAALVDHKGHRHLLDAWQSVEQQSQDAHLLLVGTGERENDLKSQAHALDLKRIRFAGYRQDVPHLMQAADLFVMPSIEEGLGTAIMDAMACGLPVVASRAGGIPELVDHEQTGFLVAPAQSDELAQRLLQILEDNTLKERLGTAAKQHSASFHYTRMVESYANLYQSMKA